MKNIFFCLLALLPCLQVSGQTSNPSPMVSVCNGTKQVLAWSSKDITAKIGTTSTTSNGKTTYTTTTTVSYDGGSKVYTNGSSDTYNTKVVNNNCLWGDVPSKEQAVDLGTTITINGKTFKVLWAPWNLGGSQNSIDGLFFSSGEDGTKYAYDSEGKTIGFTTDCSSDGKDIANQWWGGDWQIPTKEMWQLLVDRKGDSFTTGSGRNTKTTKVWANNSAGLFATFTQNESYTISYKDNDGTVNSILLSCCGLYKGASKVEYDNSFKDAQAANYLSSTVEEKTGRVNALHAWSSVGVGNLRVFTLTNDTKNSTNDYYQKNYGYSIRPVRLVPVSK